MQMTNEWQISMCEGEFCANVMWPITDPSTSHPKLNTEFPYTDVQSYVSLTLNIFQLPHVCAMAHLVKKCCI